MLRRFLPYSWEQDGYLFTMVPLPGLSKKIEGFSLDIRDTNVMRIERREVLEKLGGELGERIMAALPTIREVSAKFANYKNEDEIQTETLAELADSVSTKQTTEPIPPAPPASPPPPAL